MGNVTVPIIYYHEGMQEYLKVSLEQSVKMGNKVILIGDSKNKNLTEDIDICWYDGFVYEDSEKWKRFKKAYVHMSPNSQQFELACFKRFFVIENFVKKMNIDKFVYFDSDILCYECFQNLEVIKKYDAGISIMEETESNLVSANCGISFWSKAALVMLTDFFVDMYENSFEKLKVMYEEAKEKGGGICDMTLEGLFYELYSKDGRILNWATQSSDNTWIVDVGIGLSRNYVPKEYEYNRLIHIKKIVFCNHVPYFIRNRKRIRVIGLHFQGDRKKFMKSFFMKERLRYSEILVEILQTTRNIVKGIIRKVIGN